MNIRKIGNLKIVVVKDYDALSIMAADIIASQIKSNPNSVLGLATGSTPIGTYKELIKKFKNHKIDFSGVETFNLDEYHPLERENEQSYYHYMNEQLFDHVNVELDRRHIPNGKAQSVQAECDRYERAIADAGGIDLQILGLGTNGHIAFNEPNTHFPVRTHYAPLSQSTTQGNARYFASIDDVPKHAITMGIGTIMASQNILMLISGEAKARIANAVIRGNVDPQVPGSILQLHRSTTVILDEDAAKYLF